MPENKTFAVLVNIKLVCAAYDKKSLKKSTWESSLGAGKHWVTALPLLSRFVLVGFLRRIFMDFFAEAAAHAFGQKNCGIAIFVP